MYASETCCLREDRMTILRRTERAKRAMCGFKLMEKTSSQEFMDWQGLKETLDRIAKANRGR